MPFTFLAQSEADTAALGAALGRLLPPGTTVALYGTLGAGKTRLAQALAEAQGVDRRQVVSPTFVLIQEYQGRRPVHHIDAYRLATVDEYLDLGPEEYYAGEGLVLIEWADRVAEALPPERVDVQLEVVGPESRQFEITTHGAALAGVLPALIEWADRDRP